MSVVLVVVSYAATLLLLLLLFVVVHLPPEGVFPLPFKNQTRSTYEYTCMFIFLSNLHLSTPLGSTAAYPHTHLVTEDAGCAEQLRSTCESADRASRMCYQSARRCALPGIYATVPKGTAIAINQ